MDQIGQLLGDGLERLSRRLPRFWAVALIIATVASTIFFLAWVMTLLVR